MGASCAEDRHTHSATRHISITQQARSKCIESVSGGLTYDSCPEERKAQQRKQKEAVSTQWTDQDAARHRRDEVQLDV